VGQATALVQVDGRADRLGMLQTIGEFAREQLAVAGEAGAIALRHARRYAERAREIRDGIESTEQVSSVEGGITEEGNLQAAIDTLLETARRYATDRPDATTETLEEPMDTEIR